jgi:transcriptional regulator GlxA family with amidase domain
MNPATISTAILGYDGVQTLDLVGPLDAFCAANAAKANAYRVLTTSVDGRPFVSETGMRVTPDCALAETGALDTLIVPGGAGLRRTPAVALQVAAALESRAPLLRRIVSICTGIYAVAPTGLLDGRRATTHWRYAADVARRFPAIRLDADRIYVKDGPLYTSAGITAAIDLTLALIEEDHGAKLALHVARDLVVYLRRSGGQRQYSEPLKFQARASDRFAELSGWIAEHLDGDLSVETLAARSGLCPRQFSRRFTREFGASPSRRIEDLRLDSACDRLTNTKAGVATIAATVGFRSGDAFRRAFARRYGLSPTDYRHRFAPGDVLGPNDAFAPGDAHD